jgi:hypothetical protein
LDIELGKEIDETEIYSMHPGFRLIRLKAKMIYIAFFSKFALRKLRNRKKENSVK